MSLVMKHYRLVQLDDALGQWHDASIRKLVERILTLRIEGYGQKYPAGVVPFDASCWYASHFLICEDRGELLPVMGFQRVTLDNCRRHHSTFLPLASCRQAGCERHIRAMEELIGKFENAPAKLSYTGGFTITPRFRDDRNLVGELCQLMVALHYLFHRDAGLGHEIVTAPVVRFKVDSLLSGYGFLPLVKAQNQDDDVTIGFSSFAGEKARFMRVARFNERVIDLARPYQHWWNDRMLISTRTPEPERQLSAAVGCGQ